MPKPGKRKAGVEHAQKVLRALQRAGRPISAYEILSAIRNGNDLAPATVYRALYRLVREGQVHKLESLNAFFACRHPAHHTTPAFAICDSCGSVTEFSPHEFDESLAQWCQSSAFELSGTTVELHGTCRSCQVRAAN